jgi:hypothetical protein
MTKKITLIDRKTGAVVEVDEAPNFVVPEGFALRTPMLFMDSMQRDVRMTNATITDGSANPDEFCLNRPGFRQIANDTGRAAVAQAYKDSVDALGEAYKPMETRNPGSGLGSFGKIEMAAPVEGGVCYLQGGKVAGKWRYEQVSGWVCIPDDAPADKSKAAKPVGGGTGDARRLAYLDSVADLQQAWRR